MNIDDLTIGEVRKLAAMFGTAQAPADRRDHGFAIVVLDRGFVYVGRTITDGEWCEIAEARNIRYWGTENGLAQLVNDGPTNKTRLDGPISLRAPMRAVISILPATEAKWKR